MTAPSIDFAKLFASFDLLMQARRGPAAYYVPLLRADDEIVRFGAFCQALSLGVLPPDRYEEAIGLAIHPAIKQRAFDFFKSKLNYDAAERVALTEIASTDPALTAAMLASLRSDHQHLLASAAERYRTTGNLGDLVRAARAAEAQAGWRVAMDWLVRAGAIAPLDPGPFNELFRVLVAANQFDAVDRLGRLLGRAALHPYLVAVYTAAAKLGRADAKAAHSQLQSLQPPRDLNAWALRDARGYALQTLGAALDKLGKYEDAHKAYIEMNRHDRAADVDPERAIQTAREFEAMTLPSLPPARDDIVSMLGFARSGTTLLEIALDAHPAIEAFEESVALDIAQAQISAARRTGTTGNDPAAFFEAARLRYFSEIDRLRRKPDATVLVDKYPMRGLYAKFTQRFLPAQRSIFCIRHPYDVVLSCFRQRFNANPGMESFREWKTGIELYDFVMTEWFACHSFTESNVHYIRYDDLVADFQSAVGRVLDFVGVPWDDQVMSFAAAANDKAALTPSYQKIRQGLSLGVQTYWRNYRFLFDRSDAEPLRRWAQHFGYPTE
jgi:tetratricopeptide (TPR) repeat protein